MNIPLLKSYVLQHNQAPPVPSGGSRQEADEA